MLAKPSTRYVLPSRARRVTHSSPRDLKHHIKIQNVDVCRSRRDNHRFAGSHRIWRVCTLLRRLFFYGEFHRNFSEISSMLEIDTIHELLTTLSLLSSDRLISPSRSQPEAKHKPLSRHNRNTIKLSPEPPAKRKDRSTQKPKADRSP